MEEPVLEQEVPGSALVVIPHPDDGEGGCGGTVARWARQGCKVYFVLCTNGNKGSDDLSMSSAKLALIREDEQRKAAAALGVKEVVFLRHGDGELEDNRQFRGELVRAIRRFKPDVMFCTEPQRLDGHNHRDHRISGQVALDAAFPYARDHLHFPELHQEFGLEPHKVGAAWIWGTDRPDVYVDISDTLDVKAKALACHVSQLGDRDVREFIERRAKEQGEKVNVPYAEGFRRISFRR